MLLQKGRVMKEFLESFGVNIERCDVRKASCMSEGLKEEFSDCLPKQCYQNIANFMSVNQTKYPLARYVLGFHLYSIIPIEHAFLEIDGVFYDPTLEMFANIDSDLIGVIYFSHEDLKQFVKYYRTAPNFDVAIYAEQYHTEAYNLEIKKKFIENLQMTKDLTNTQKP